MVTADKPRICTRIRLNVQNAGTPSYITGMIKNSGSTDIGNAVVACGTPAFFLLLPLSDDQTARHT